MAEKRIRETENRKGSRLLRNADANRETTTPGTQEIKETARKEKKMRAKKIRPEIYRMRRRRGGGGGGGRAAAACGHQR